MKAVRSLVELGEPYRDNHCEHLEAEIDEVTRELEGATKELRELSTVKDELSPELERLRVGRAILLTVTLDWGQQYSIPPEGICQCYNENNVQNTRPFCFPANVLCAWKNQATLAEDLARRRQINREAARSARVGRSINRAKSNQRQALTKSGTTAITSRSFEAMQSRALRIFRRSMARLQALTDEDFQRVAALSTVAGDDAVGNDNRFATTTTEITPVDAPEYGDNTARSPSSESADDDRDNADDNLNNVDEAENPTPSLSARHSKISNCSSSCTADCGAGSYRNGREASAKQNADADAKPREKEKDRQGEDIGCSAVLPSSMVPAAVLQVLRATVVMLGGCGLGALPSDKKLWRAVRPMLLDGSLRHRVRHFDRRVEMNQCTVTGTPLERINGR